AQTLGDRTNDAVELRELVEAKFVDALRSVAATMSLADLQEQRAAFVQAVQTAVARDLELNGLELESASLTKLDQTDTKYFNPNNAFDAEGLAALIQAELAIQQRRIESERTAETLAISKKRDVEIADQDRAIAVADRSRAESEARAKAEEARAIATTATESVATARDVAIAERER